MTGRTVIGFMLNIRAQAKHLTMIQWRIFRRVKPNEMLFQAWQKHNKEQIAPNLTELAKRFDRVSFWVATMVVRGSTFKIQAKTIEKFIDVMHVREECSCCGGDDQRNMTPFARSSNPSTTTTHSCKCWPA